MHAQLITYRVTGVSHAQYLEEMVGPDAEAIGALDSLVSKVWLGDEQDETHGGFYVWVDRPAMDAFMASPLVETIVGRPYVSDVTSVDWPVDAVPSVVTRGVEEAAARD